MKETDRLIAIATAEQAFIDYYKEIHKDKSYTQTELKKKAKEFSEKLINEIEVFLQ